MPAWRPRIGAHRGAASGALCAPCRCTASIPTGRRRPHRRLRRFAGRARRRPRRLPRPPARRGRAFGDAVSPPEAARAAQAALERARGVVQRLIRACRAARRRGDRRAAEEAGLGVLPVGHGAGAWLDSPRHGETRNSRRRPTARCVIVADACSSSGARRRGRRAPDVVVRLTTGEPDPLPEDPSSRRCAARRSPGAPR